MTTPFYSQGGGTTPLGAVPIIPVVASFSPSSTDISGVNGPFKLGQTWIDTSTASAYILVDLSPLQNQIVATWSLTAGGSGTLDTLSGDVGIAVPTAGDIKIAGGIGISTVAAGSTVTINSTAPAQAEQFVTNLGGPVTPSASGEVFVNASVTTFTDGSVANTVKTEVQSASHTILIGSGTNTASTPLSPSATSGVPIISQGVGANPIYGTAVVAGGGTGDTSFTPYTVICGGTTSTGNLQNVVDTGTAGQVLTSNGAASLPTWQDTSLNLSIDVDSFTPPGTDPVVPNGSDQITLTAGQVPAGTIGAQCIRTDSLAANAITIQVQRSAAVGASAVASNGVSHFNSADFSVDANGFVSMIAPGGTGITAVAIQTFTTSGTYTPTPGMKYCIVEVIGGGGAGGGLPAPVPGEDGAGTGGGAGEYARGIFNAATIGVSQVVTIGAGGLGVLGADGSPGGNSSLGALISANGGLGGFSVTNTTSNLPGGSGGSGGAGGSFRSKGENGTFWIFLGTSVFWSGAGGSSVYGSGGISHSSANTNGNNGSVYGSGGSGCLGPTTFPNAIKGGDGSAGIIIITEYI